MRRNITLSGMIQALSWHSRCKVAREVVEGPIGPIVMIVETIQCKVD
jgi:hypothetical protein